MSKETREWLGNNILIGNVAKRGRAWWDRSGVDSQGRPNHFDGPVPLEEVRARLFSWHAVEAPVAIIAPSDLEHMQALDDAGNPIRYIVQPGRKAIVADDNYTVLGMFREGYQAHQYDEWLLNNVANILDDDLSISSAGLLRNRAVAWVEVGVPENVVTKEGVEFRPNLLATTSFDGSLATTFKRTITATVCDNTLGMALGERGAQVKVRHSRNSIAKVADARLALEIVHKTADEFSKQVEALCATTVTEMQFAKALEKLVPIDDTSKRSKSLGEAKRDQMKQLYNHDARVAPWRGTAFAVVQMMNTFEHHLKAVKGDTIRAERNMFAALDGSIEQSDRQTLQILAEIGALELAGAGLSSPSPSFERA